MGHTSPSTSGQSRRKVPAAPSRTGTRTDLSRDGDIRQPEGPSGDPLSASPGPSGLRGVGTSLRMDVGEQQFQCHRASWAHSGLRCPQAVLGSRRAGLSEMVTLPAPPTSKQPWTAGGCSVWYPAHTPRKARVMCAGSRHPSLGLDPQHQTPPSPPTTAAPSEQRQTPGGVPPHLLALLSLQTPTKKTSSLGQLSPAATALLCKKLKPYAEWKLLSSPEVAHGVRCPAPPRVPVLPAGRRPALKPKPKPDILVLPHLHALWHPPASESTPRAPRSMNPATGSRGPGPSAAPAHPPGITSKLLATGGPVPVTNPAASGDRPAACWAGVEHLLLAVTCRSPQT